MSSQQSPGTTTAFQNEIRSMLRLADATSMAGSLGRLLMGIAVCLGMGVIVASLTTLCLSALFDHTWIGWSGWYLVYLLVLVPLLVWHERRSREDYVTDAIRFADPSPSSSGQYDLNQVVFAFGAVTSLFVWGPRALIDGFRGVRGHRSLTQEAVFDRAAALVVALARVEGGIPIKDLLVPPENMQVFGSAVDLLDTLGCIGKASDGRALWLNSTYRQKLNQRRLKGSETSKA